MSNTVKRIKWINVSNSKQLIAVSWNKTLSIPPSFCSSNSLTISDASCTIARRMRMCIFQILFTKILFQEPCLNLIPSSECLHTSNLIHTPNKKYVTTYTKTPFSRKPFLRSSYNHPCVRTLVSPYKQKLSKPFRCQFLPNRTLSTQNLHASHQEARSVRFPRASRNSRTQIVSSVYDPNGSSASSSYVYDAAPLENRS